MTPVYKIQCKTSRVAKLMEIGPETGYRCLPGSRTEKAQLARDYIAFAVWVRRGAEIRMRASCRGYPIRPYMWIKGPDHLRDSI